MQEQVFQRVIHLVFERVSHARVVNAPSGLVPLATVRFIKSGLSKPITLSCKARYKTAFITAQSPYSPGSSVSFFSFSLSIRPSGSFYDRVSSLF